MNTLEARLMMLLAAALACACAGTPDYERPGSGIGTTEPADDADTDASGGSDPSADDESDDDDPGGSPCWSATCGGPADDDDADADDDDVDDTGAAGTTDDGEPGCIPMPWYADVDGDGFGDPDDVIMSCDPVGVYSLARAGDCCDLDADAHPDQDSYFSMPTVCGGFDYDCDGVESPKLTCTCVPDAWSLHCSPDPNPDCIVWECGATPLTVCQVSSCEGTGLVSVQSHGTQTCR